MEKIYNINIMTPNEFFKLPKYFNEVSTETPEGEKSIVANEFARLANGIFMDNVEDVRREMKPPYRDRLAIGKLRYSNNTINYLSISLEKYQLNLPEESSSSPGDESYIMSLQEIRGGISCQKVVYKLPVDRVLRCFDEGDARTKLRLNNFTNSFGQPDNGREVGLEEFNSLRALLNEE